MFLFSYTYYFESNKLILIANIMNFFCEDALSGPDDAENTRMSN